MQERINSQKLSVMGRYVDGNHGELEVKELERGLAEWETKGGFLIWEVT